MPEHVVLDGGLDLIRARPAVPAGRIRECLNYEVGYRRGNTRIDGFERFDGRISPSSTTGWVLEFPKGGVTGTFVAPEDLTWELGVDVGSAGTLVRIEDADPNWRLFVLFRTGRARPFYDSTITGTESGASFVLDDTTLVGIEHLPDHYATHEEYITALHEFANILRSEVFPVPGTGTILGLHFHEDSLYAVRDIAEVNLVPGGELILVPGQFVYNAAGQVGEVIAVDVETGVAHIVAVDTYGFDVSDGMALHAAMTIRFEDGDGDFPRHSGVSSSGGWSGYVGHVRLMGGDFADGTAGGIAAFINGPDAAAVAGQIFTSAAGGTMVVEEAMFAAVSALTSVGTVSTLSDIAGLWRSSDDGWIPASPPQYIGFVNGAVEPPEIVYVQESRYFVPTVVTASGAGTPWTGDINGLKVDDNAGPSLSGTANPLTGFSSQAIKLTGFNTNLEEGVVPKSFRLHVDGRGNTVCPAYAGILKAKLASGPSSRPDYLVSPSCGSVWETKVAAATILAWNGGQSLSREAINLSSFGFQLNGSAVAGSSISMTLDFVQLQVVLDVPQGALLYLWNGATNLGTLTAASLILESGDWSTGDAAGRIRIEDAGISGVPEGTEIRTAPDGGGDLIATTVGSGSTILLPGSRPLAANNSKYEFISHNFYASEERNAIYGVSGAGPAFWYDGTTLDFIDTGVGVEREKPRHLAAHLHRLHLGYMWGEVYVSAPGDPLNYAGEDFAATYGFGDKVTGLMPAAGDVLAVFTESATHALAGANGDDANPPRQTVINHRVGAIEYTVQNVGNRPIFTSFRGIETLETMDQFGDLFTAPLTYDVAPFLLRRLQTAAGVEGSNESVVNSVVVRNKNQYRLFFADGYVLTLTQVGPEREPQSTIQRYYFNSDTTQFARVFATGSGVTSDGRDRAFFSVEDRPDIPNPGTKSVTSPEVDYVYELDRGRSFDGGTIEAFFTTTHYFGQQQQASMQTKRDNVVQLHGECPGFASIRLSRAMNYEDMDLPELPFEDIALGALSNPPEETAKPKYTKGRLTGRGFAVSLRVSHESAIEFPHAIQMITFLDDVPLRANR